MADGGIATEDLAAGIGLVPLRERVGFALPGDAGILPAVVARKRDPEEVRLPAAPRIATCRNADGPSAYPKAVDAWVEIPIGSIPPLTLRGK